ncbi:MAG: replication initiator protein [Microviridae sp.]|nr:MAG: replication initiator protein [Microviridae sp.]
MPCYHPLQAYQSTPGVKPKFKPFPNSSLILLPCGRCVGCRLERSRQWALRCVHEASLYEDNSFLTLTYSPESLGVKANPYSLDKSDFQKFMKRLRKSCNSRIIRYYMCGEYGDALLRPHFHVCLFNYQFPDLELHTVVNGQRLFTSRMLSDLWPFGFSSIGSLTFESAAYVARYVMKKVNGNLSDKVCSVSGLRHYERVNYSTGEIFEVLPEYNDMSRRPGIGTDWWKKYRKDLEKDFITSRGVKLMPPRFYDRLLKRDGFDGAVSHWRIKQKRSAGTAEAMEEALFTDRLIVKEKVKLKRISLLKRSLD